MKNIMKKILLGVAAFVVAALPVQAADTSVTEVVRKANTGVGTKPVSGYAKGTVTAAAVSAGALTIDAPPASVPIAAWTANVRDTSGRPLFPAIVFVSPTFYVSSSNGTSGTLVSGSLVTIDISYDRNQ